jgi:urea transporter
MHLGAILFVIGVGLCSDWGDALWALSGYLFAFILIGLTRGKVLES